MKDAVVIGGGLSGLVAAILLRQGGYEVTLIEKKKYPFHRVCGEYISNEVAGFLIREGLDFRELNAINIDELHFSSVNGNDIKTRLKMGGFGLSRYAFDAFLFNKAKLAGVQCLDETEVEEVSFRNDIFQVKTKDSTEIQTKICIGAFGKKSVLDRKMARGFTAEKSGFVGVKMHYEGQYPLTQIGLHNFKGGYCGISNVEGGKVNFCYMTAAEPFKTAGDFKSFQNTVLYQNPHIRAFLENARPAFDKPLVISQMYFGVKNAVENHMLMCGDAAGAITPLTGNGMAMAIHSAKLCAEEVLAYLSGEISRETMEKGYDNRWRRNFKNRIFVGNLFQPFFGKAMTSALSFKILKLHPNILPGFIAQTHGKEII